MAVKLGRQVVDELVRAASGITPEHAPRGEGPSRTHEPPSSAPQPQTLNAKPELPDVLKKVGSEAEAELLKRKPLPDPAKTLKMKREEGQARVKEQLASPKGVALKKKPIPKEQLTPKPEAMLPGEPLEGLKRARPLRSRRLKRESVLRAVADPEFLDKRSGGDALTARGHIRECEIQWWRGYVTSQLIAIESRTDGATIIVASSPSFRCRKRDALRETPEAEAALRALVASLEAGGWTVARRGADWFGLRFRSSGSVEHPEPAAHHGSSTG